MAGGFMGRLLWVDLTSGAITEEALGADLQRDWIGGYGIGARLLYDRMAAGVDPLGPQNILGMVTGALTGTPCIEGNRFTVVCKSPLTQGWGDANCGGQFGPALKFAGYDAVFFTGQAPEPVYLFVDAGRAELRPATDLWGQDANATEDALYQRHGQDAQAAVIGQAGEQLSLIAGIVNDKGRLAARSGVGAVMGSKRLKAVVVRGKLPVPIADPDRAKVLRRQYLKSESNAFRDTYKTTGTIGILGSAARNGDSPVKNWAGVGPVDLPAAAEHFSQDAVMAYVTKKYGCWQCTMACGGHQEVKEGPWAGTSHHKTEYETSAAFGTLALNGDYASTIKCNELCNRYGFDAISAGATVAFAIDCYEHGILTARETDGLELTWGNAAAIVELLDRMGRRAGIGDVLADGVQRAAERIGKGAAALAMHVGGQEVSMHDPKYDPQFATMYLLDATPGRHTQGGENTGGGGQGFPYIKRNIYTGRAAQHRQGANWMHVVNAAGVCQFGFWSYPYSFITDFLTAVTGEAWDDARVERTGERIGTLRHLYNLREGQNPLQRRLPDRVLGNPPLADGKLAGLTIDMDTLLNELLPELGWDRVTARPSREKLVELGLADLA